MQFHSEQDLKRDTEQAIQQLPQVIANDIRNSILSLQLYRLPSNVVLKTKAGNHYWLKCRPPFKDVALSEYREAPVPTTAHDLDVHTLAGEFVLLTEKHFNMQGNQLIKEYLQ